MVTARNRNNRQASNSEGETSTMVAETVSEGTTVKVGSTKVDLDTRVSLPISVPLGLRIALEKRAKENGVDMGDFVRPFIAEAVGYTGDLGTTKRGKPKTMTDEEKRAEAARRAAERNAAIEAMLKEHGLEVAKRKTRSN